MITTRLNLLKDGDIDKEVLVHAIAVGRGSDRRFIMGMCYDDGTPLGVLVRHTGTEVRKWQRIDHVFTTAEKMFGASMVSFTVAIPEARNDHVFEFFWKTYRLGERIGAPNDPLEQDRLSIVEASEHARSSNTSDAG